MEMICPKTDICNGKSCIHYGEHEKSKKCYMSFSPGNSKNPSGCPMCICNDGFFNEDDFKI